MIDFYINLCPLMAIQVCYLQSKICLLLPPNQCCQALKRASLGWSKSCDKSPDDVIHFHMNTFFCSAQLSEDRPAYTRVLKTLWSPHHFRLDTTQLQSVCVHWHQLHQFTTTSFGSWHIALHSPNKTAKLVYGCSWQIKSPEVPENLLNLETFPHVWKLFE